VRIVIEVIDAIGIERRRPALYAVHRVALVQQELRQIGAVLAGDARNQCALSHNILALRL